MKLKIISLLCALLSAWSVQAQNKEIQVVNANGGTATINGIVYEWNVGEPITQTVAKSGIVITQGYLQPMKTKGGNSTATQTLEGLSQEQIKLYPNPATSMVMLQPAFKSKGTLSYTLYDATGKVMLNKTEMLQLGNELQEIDLTRLADGHYWLQIHWQGEASQQTGTFKIDKLN